MARFALRDLRGGLAGLRIFCLCIALGVAAIVGVESLAKALDDGLGLQGRVILGGDASFSLIHRRLSPAEERLPRPLRLAIDDRDAAGDGPNRKRGRSAGGDQGRRAVLAADWRGGA